MDSTTASVTPFLKVMLLYICTYILIMIVIIQVKSSDFTIREEAI